MAHVQITLLEGRTVEQKRRAVKRITEVLCKELNVKPEKLTIVFVEVPLTVTRAMVLSCRTGQILSDSGFAAPRLIFTDPNATLPGTWIFCCCPWR